MFFKYSIVLILLGFFIFFSEELSSQSKPYRGPTDESGEVGARRIGLMNGNRVLLRFSNRVSLGGWPNPLESLWPNDDTGLNILDEFNLIIGNLVFIDPNGNPVTDETEIQTRTDLDTLWFAQSSSLTPGFEDVNDNGTIAWSFEPVYGYFNRNQDYPALSDRPDSWPADGWPIEGLEKDWAGEWKGRYGRGKITAELEAYFAANDAQDQEYLNVSSAVKYYPRPNVKIGDIHPEDITQQKGLPWGGLGLRVEARAYQWNNLQARDAVFFEYGISNISDYDMARTVFGFYLDASNGNKAPNVAAEDQIGYFDKLQDLSYTWSQSGSGFGGGRPPVSGWAFLESPGIGNDGTDNDDDGLVDEKRDNEAIAKVGPAEGITDMQKFLAFYNLNESQLREHWDADEDQDWRDGFDANGNGIYDPGEDPGDDVGTDGVSPLDINYNGPDPDGTECNHKPDFDEGLNSGEPNFGLLDVSESDMLGLTSFHMFPHPSYGSPQIKFDKECYRVIADNTLVEFFGTPSNLYSAFGSGAFRFSKGRTERLSMANINSYEELAALNAPGHVASSLFTKKKVVQGIYETDYRFATAPLTPVLTATAGDGKVYLSWNDVADKYTREPFLQGANDFEGYKVYKASDKYFRDAEMLYDAYGNAAGKKPIFQCDLKDSITGTPPHTFFNGLGFNLGEDTGIQHFYIDEDVQNGRTYYYAVAAYDFGIADSGALGVNIGPTENKIVISLDENENINYTGSNVAVATPGQQASGFTSGISLDDPLAVEADATVNPVIFNVNQVKNENEYKIVFETAAVDYLRNGAARHKRDRFLTTTGYSVFNMTEGSNLVYRESASAPVANNWESAIFRNINKNTEYQRPNSSIGITSELFEGLQVSLKPDAFLPAFNPAKSGWVNGNKPIEVRSNAYVSQFFCYDYDIVFSETPYTTQTTLVNSANPVLDLDNIRLPNNRILLNNSFPFYVINKSVPLDSTGNFEKLDLVVNDTDSNGVYDPGIDYIFAGYQTFAGTQKIFAGTVFGFRFPGGVIPSPGDVYRVDFSRPLQDSISFKVNVETLNTERITQGINNVKVVPNPYIVTNAMEPAVNQTGYNQQRRLMFIHLPAQCNIKIFTASGVMIRELDVENSMEDGTFHWDLLTREGLETAAGIYVFLVESKVTGDKKIGKFAIVK